MDRLEKALEKSRQQRAALGGNVVGAPPKPHSVTGTVAGVSGNTPAYTFATPDNTDVNEAQFEQNRIIAHHTRNPQADIYRHLRTKVLQIMKNSGMKTLAITSPHYGDGKTTVGINLAISIALDLKQTVLMVDLDIRKPRLHEYLGVPAEPGLTDYLLHNTPIHDCLMRPPFERINTLPAGSALEHSSELLGSPKMIALAHELKTRYPDRMVIYDMPPALDQDDALAFLPQVDAVLVVVRDGVTRTDDLKRCLASLSGANVIGTVLNNCW